MSLVISTEVLVNRVKWSLLGLMGVMISGILLSMAIGVETTEALTSSINTCLGVFAATFANLSGAGGGVVFIPVFNYLNFTPSQMLANSFGIQCFGMTAGALTWYLHYRKGHRKDPTWAPLSTIVWVTSLTSIAGIWSAYGGYAPPPASLHEIFAVFSMVLGAALLSQVLIIKPKIQLHKTLAAVDYLMLVIIGYFGGMVTAWLSVGVGELLVLYLIFRGFCTTMSVAAAVIVTAFSVWSAAIEHQLIGSATIWQVVLFAGPGAVIGGILARTIAGVISTKSLKVVLGGWIFVMGLLS